MSAAVYAQVVEATIARLVAVEARPKPPVLTIVADASTAVHYCRACDLSWRGPAPCWGCAGSAVVESGLTASERSLWAFSNTSSGTFTERN